MSQLKEKLLALHNKNYSLYKTIKKSYKFDNFDLKFDHIQGDSYAMPSRAILRFEPNNHRIPDLIVTNKLKNKSICDFINRTIYMNFCEHNKSIHNSRNGRLEIAKPSQVVLERSAVSLNEKNLEVRLGIGLPANGRRINGELCAEILVEILPNILRKIIYDNLDLNRLSKHICILEDANSVRNQLKDKGLVSFVANDSILARKSGNSDLPLLTAKPFKSCESHIVEITTPNSGKIIGMGVKKGVTLIVGGGFHGKSTLIDAIVDGVYDHIPGDGRELVVSLKDSFKIKAEEGRPISGTNISPFINNLPNEKNTTSFYTDNASGSTSQAANVIEAMNSRAKLLILDEDTSATNFLIRDHRMSLLTTRQQEPITTLLDQIRNLVERVDLSFILVMGGNSQYFEVADNIIQMNKYCPIDVIQEVEKIIKEYPRDVSESCETQYVHDEPFKDLKKIKFTVRDKYKKKIENLKTLYIGENEIDISYLENFKENGQLLYIADLLYTLQSKESKITLGIIEKYLHTKKQIGSINTERELSEIRPIDLISIINRIRLQK